MTMQSVIGNISMGSIDVYSWNTAPNFSTVATLSTANSKCFLIFSPQRSCSLRTIGFKTGTVTTGATLDVRVETVDLTTGYPTGTLVGTNTNISHTLADTDDNKMIICNALTADATLVAGEWYAVGVVNPGTSYGNFVIQGYADANLWFPYSAVYDGAAWAKGTAYQPMWVLLDSSGVGIPCDVLPFTSVNSALIDNAGTLQQEMGNSFTLPYKVSVCGADIWGDFDEVTSIKLYEGTTLKRYVDIDPDVRGGTATGVFKVLWKKDGDGNALTSDTIGYTVAANTEFKITYENATSGTDVTIYYFGVEAAAHLGMLSGGTNVYRVYRKNAESFTTDTATRAYVEPRFCGFDDGTATGGGGGWFGGE